MTPTSPHRWNTKLVRDLEWALASPAVFSPGDGPLRKIVPLAQSRAWLGSLDACPQPLLDFIVEQQQDGKGTALGFYFAQLIEYWIRFCPVLSPLAVRVNVPIKAASGLGTVGQLKFLVQHADLERGSAAECDPSTQLEVSGVPRLYHWEASVKYFLHASTPNGDNVTAGGRALRHAAGGKTPDKLRDVLATGEWPTGAAIDAAPLRLGRQAASHAALRHAGGDGGRAQEVAGAAPVLRARQAAARHVTPRLLPRPEVRSRQQGLPHERGAERGEDRDGKYTSNLPLRVCFTG